MARTVASAKPAEPQTAAPELKTETPQNVPAVKSKMQSFIDSVFDGDRAKQVIDSLGNAVTFDKFRASVATAIMNNPELLACQPPLVFREVARVAALGLVFDHHLGEAYLFASYDGKTKKKDKPQCRVGYRGLMKLARNESDVMIYAHEVYEKDEFECVLGLEKTLIHKPNVFSERGEVVGYYAVAKYRDSHDTDFEPMSRADCLKIRDRTEAWKAFAAGKISNPGPWKTDEVEMSKKTVIRRLWKRLPSGPKMTEAIRIEDEAEGIVPQPGQAMVSSPQPKPQPANEALDRFSKPRGNGTVTDVPQDDEFPPGDDGDPGNQGDEAGDAKPAENASQGTTEAKADPVIYTEPEEEEQKAEPAAASKSIAIPEMPPEIAKPWLTEGKWMDGWKWISVTVTGLEDDAVRRALLEEHMIMLQAVAAKSAGYKDAVERFIGAYGIKLKPAAATEGTGK